MYSEVKRDLKSNSVRSGACDDNLDAQIKFILEWNYKPSLAKDQVSSGSKFPLPYCLNIK